MTIKVVDEETLRPLTNCTVKTRYLVKDHWNEPDEYNEMEAAPNEEGFCTFSGVDCISDFGGGVIADGYYRAGFSEPSTGLNRILNRWEPWNPTIEVKMRKIKKPMPMATKWVKSLKIKIWDTPIGFDLEKADWVAPHGKGESIDFFVTMHRRFVNSSDYDAVGKITFPNDGDGIQLYRIPDDFKSSSYTFPYEAPTDSYSHELTLERHATLRETKISFNPDTDMYLCRVRTQKDKDGNIVSACYGRVDRRIEIGWGEVFDFEYHFNPVPNERSLEYNGVNLLKKK
jgi:hypothetical protein